MKLLENLGINEYVIELVKSKQLPYRLIYILSPLVLEILKMYIETLLKTGFIQLSKLPAGALILFHKKSNCTLQLCVH